MELQRVADSGSGHQRGRESDQVAPSRGGVEGQQGSAVPPSHTGPGDGHGLPSGRAGHSDGAGGGGGPRGQH